MNNSLTLIITVSYDNTTNVVIDWIKFLKKDFLRINETDRIKDVSISYSKKETTISFSLSSKKIDTKQIKSVWFRRGALRLENVNTSTSNSIYLNNVLTFRYAENKQITEFIESFLIEKKHINKYKDIFINKLIVLFTAKRIGLDIPSTFVGNNQSLEKSFPKKMITKALSENYIYDESNNFSSGGGTKKVNQINLDDVFSYSLFQELLVKKFELRIFYLNGVCYSSAVFSQNNKKTKTDFRNYDRVNPNRVVPHKLPKEVETQIAILMNQLDMNCGSIDIVYNNVKKYVFLEVNPVGQFQQVSFPCNYNLEKIVAETL